MMNSKQQSISRLIFSVGIVWGVMSSLIALWGSFTLGVNDTLPEVLAIIFYILSFVPAGILAFWKRRLASIWLISLGLFCMFGFNYQMWMQHEITCRHILAVLFIGIIPALCLGLFGLITDNHHWPKLRDS
jgi:hypothetical protein